MFLYSHEDDFIVLLFNLKKEDRTVIGKDVFSIMGKSLSSKVIIIHEFLI